MSITEIKQKALASLEGNWTKVILLTFIMFLLNIVLLSIGEIIVTGSVDQWLEQYTNPYYVAPKEVFIFNAVFAILLIPFSIGIYWFFLSFVRNENPNISYVFSAYKDGKTSIKLIFAVFVQVIFLTLWSLLFVIPGIIKTFSYSQTFFILKDNPDMGILEAITESRKKMNGLKMKFFLMILSFIGWGILCLFTFGIGYLVLVPYFETTIAMFYEQLICGNKPETTIEHLEKK